MQKYEGAFSDYYQTGAIDARNGQVIDVMDNDEVCCGTIVSNLRNVYVVDIDGTRNVVRKEDMTVVQSLDNVAYSRHYRPSGF